MRRTRYLLAGALAIAAAVTGAVFAQSSGAAPAPVVTSVTPAADTTGSQVVVSGSNLTLPPGRLPAEILFGGIKAKVNSCAPLTGAASSCNVTVPAQCAGHKVADVRVVVGTLESAVSPGDQFTYTDSAKAPPCPGASPSGTPAPASSGTPPAATPAGTPSPGSTPSTGPVIPASSKSPAAVPVVSGNA